MVALLALYLAAVAFSSWDPWHFQVFERPLWRIASAGRGRFGVPAMWIVVVVGLAGIEGAISLRSKIAKGVSCLVVLFAYVAGRLVAWHVVITDANL